MSSFIIKRNDTAPAITATLSADGTVVNLSGASVRFHMDELNGTEVVDAAATVVDAANGEVSYQWTAADTAITGRFSAEWEVTFADATVRTFPNPGFTTVIVYGDLA